MKGDPRLDAVRNDLREMGGVAICFSGGLDSTVLADLAFGELGERAVAVVVDVPMMTLRQRKAAQAIADFIGIEMVKAPLDYGDLPGILENTHSRCYICKTAMYSAVRRKAEELGLPYVVNGEIVDDLSEDRPGMGASEENGIRRPFLDAGIGRDAIRPYIDSMDLPVTMVKDTCMLMRYPEGTPVTESDLRLAEDLEAEVREVTGIHQIRVRRKGDSFSVQTSTVEHDILFGNLDAVGNVFTRRGLRFEADPSGYDK